MMLARSCKPSNPPAQAMRAARLAAVLLTVAAYTVLAPFGYAALAVLCTLWRRDPSRRARRLQTVPSRA